MKTLLTSKRAASPLTKYKTRYNIEEVFVEYNDDATLFSKRAYSQQWQSTSCQLSQQAGIFNANLSLTKTQGGDFKEQLKEIDNKLQSILNAQDEFLEPDYVGMEQLYMHQSFDQASIFTNYDNLNDVEICSSAFDQIMLFVEDYAISEMLTKIKNILLQKAAYKTFIQDAQQRANVILDQKLVYQQITGRYIELENTQLQKYLYAQLDRYAKLQAEYAIIYKLQLKYEGDSSLQEQINAQLIHVNTDLVKDNAKKAYQRDEYMERTKRLTKVIYKQKEQNDYTLHLLRRSDEHLKGCKGERDDLLVATAYKDEKIQQITQQLDRMQQYVQNLRKYHADEVYKLNERLEMGGNLEGIKMKDVDGNYQLSYCIRDGVAALVAISEESKQDVLNSEFGVERQQLFNLRHLLVHMQNFAVQEQSEHFFRADYVDTFVVQRSEAVQVTTEPYNQRIVYKYIKTDKPQLSNNSGIDDLMQAPLTGRKLAGSLTNRSREAYLEILSAEEFLRRVAVSKMEVLRRLYNSRVVIVQNSMNALPGYYGDLYMEVLRRRSSIISHDSQLPLIPLRDGKAIYPKLYNAGSEQLQNLNGTQNVENEQQPNMSQHVAGFHEQLRHLQQNINSVIVTMEKSSSEELNVVEALETNLANGAGSDAKHYNNMVKKIQDQVHSIVAEKSFGNGGQHESVLDYLRKKSQQLSKILNIPLEMLQSAIDEVGGLRNTTRGSAQDESGGSRQIQSLSNISDQYRLLGKQNTYSLSLSPSDTNLELSELAEFIETFQPPAYNSATTDMASYTVLLASELDAILFNVSLRHKYGKSVLDYMTDSKESKRREESTCGAQSSKDQEQGSYQRYRSNSNREKDTQFYLIDEIDSACRLLKQPPLAPRHLKITKPIMLDDTLIDSKISEDLDSGRWEQELRRERTPAVAEQPGLQVQKEENPKPETGTEHSGGSAENLSGDFLVAEVSTTARKYFEENQQRQRKITDRSRVSRKTSARPVSAMTPMLNSAFQPVNGSITGPQRGAAFSYSTRRTDSNTNHSGSINCSAQNYAHYLETWQSEEQNYPLDPSGLECEQKPALTTSGNLLVFVLDKGNLAMQLHELAPEQLLQIQHQVRYIITMQDCEVQVEYLVSKDKIVDVLIRSTYQQTNVMIPYDEQIQTDRTIENSISDHLIFKDMMSIIETGVNESPRTIQARMDKQPPFLNNQLRCDADRIDMIQQCISEAAPKSVEGRLTYRISQMYKDSGEIIRQQGLELDSRQSERNEESVKKARILEKAPQSKYSTARKVAYPEKVGPGPIQVGVPVLDVVEPLFPHVERSAIKKHPYAGDFEGHTMRSLLQPPLMEQFILQHPADRVFYKFLPLSQKIEGSKFAPAVAICTDATNLTAPAFQAATKEHFIREIGQLTNSEAKLIPSPLSNLKGGTSGYKPQSLLPQVTDCVGYVRMSACALASCSLQQFFNVTDLGPCDRVFIEQTEYARIPVSHAVVKPISWVKAFVAAMLRSRLDVSVAYICYNYDQMVSVDQAKFSVIPGQLDASQALSLSKFALYWVRYRYGAKSLVQAAMWNLVVNLVYHQYSDQQIYIFARLFFDDLPQDFQELYLDILRQACAFDYDPVQAGERAIQGLGMQPAERRLLSGVKTIHIDAVFEFVKALLPSFSDQRVQAFYSSILAVQYQKASKSSSSSTAISPAVELYTFVSMLLFAYASYRKSAFQAVVQVLKFFGKDLQQASFREFLALLDLKMHSFTVSEIYYAYEREGILRFEDVGKLFCEFQIARFCEIQARTLYEVVNNDILRMTNACAIVYQRMQTSMHKILRHMSRYQQLRIRGAFEILQTDILVYDVSSCINGFYLVIQLIIQSLGDKAPDACLAVIAGTVSSLNQVISDV